jgi:predicted DNA-binding antitoxin AbrB/MazE fold protein
MLQTIEAIIDEKGILRILEPVDLPKNRRVIVTILNEEPTEEIINRAVQHQNIALLEKKQADGYAKFPPKKEEIGEWETEQEWGEK